MNWDYGMAPDDAATAKLKPAYSPFVDGRYVAGRDPLTVHNPATGERLAEVAAAGQAVILAPGAASGVEALAWGRRLRSPAASDPQLRDFTEAWLGEGAPKPCQN